MLKADFKPNTPLPDSDLAYLNTLAYMCRQRAYCRVTIFSGLSSVRTHNLLIIQHGPTQREILLLREKHLSRYTSINFCQRCAHPKFLDIFSLFTLKTFDEANHISETTFITMTLDDPSPHQIQSVMIKVLLYCLIKWHEKLSIIDK